MRSKVEVAYIICININKFYGHFFSRLIKTPMAGISTSELFAVSSTEINNYPPDSCWLLHRSWNVSQSETHLPPASGSVATRSPPGTLCLGLLAYCGLRHLILLALMAWSWFNQFLIICSQLITTVFCFLPIFVELANLHCIRMHSVNAFHEWNSCRSCFLWKICDVRHVPLFNASTARRSN